MHILTTAEMREADRRTIEDIGVSGQVLMESAGRGVVGAMEEHLPELGSSRITIVCGKGNNGGDGLVVLRSLCGLGYDARAFVLAPFEELSNDALDNLQSALKLGLPVDALPTEDDWSHAMAEIETSDVIVDAILGTGLSQHARGLPLRAIEDLETLPATKVAVDVPSGLASGTGRVLGSVLSANLTVALAAPKVCHFLPPACTHCGTIEIVEIGIPPSFLVSGTPSLETIEPEEMAALLPARSAGAHKGAFGHLLIVAGSAGKSGAAVMAAQAALRSGVGLVTVATAKSALAPMASHLAEAMWAPLPETEGGTLAFAALDRLRELVKGRDALAIGPGLGLEPEVSKLVRQLVRDCELPTVVDADGLNALSESDEGALPRHGALALTPHPGEAGRLLGRTSVSVQDDRLDAVRTLAESAHAHVLLKGFRTLVSDPAGNTKVNLTGNAGMATGGTGDVLTGIVGGLLARGFTAHDALTLGAHVHGAAGDLAASDVGQTALVATDLVRKLPAALRSLGAP